MVTLTAAASVTATFAPAPPAPGDPTLFQPRIAIFVRDRPAWVELPPRLTAFETLPP